MIAYLIGTGLIGFGLMFFLAGVFLSLIGVTDMSRTIEIGLGMILTGVVSCAAGIGWLR